MTDGLLTGAAIALGGVVAYKVVRRMGSKLALCAKRKVSVAARKTSEMLAEARRGFLDGFVRAYHRDGRKSPSRRPDQNAADKAAGALQGHSAAMEGQKRLGQKSQLAVDGPG